MIDWEKIEVGLKEYRGIMKTFEKVNAKRNLEFQKSFNNFYRIQRRRSKFYKDFYKKLEASKGKNPDFEEVLVYLWKASGRKNVEKSFASKLVHTLNPNMPILDSVVLDHFGLGKEVNAGKHRLGRGVELYDALGIWYREYLESPEGKKDLEKFDKKFHHSGITDIKKLDFMIWMDR